jgi:GrpB-like predicted nucleotidyltransferase (UPF0157 family)
MAGVTLLPYCEDWPRRFREAREELLALFADPKMLVEHIGSTAVPGLSAKPVLDLLLGAVSLARIEAAIPALEARGYAYVPKYERELPERRYFVRDADGNGRRLRIHLHAVVTGSPIWRQQLHFRDALRADPVLRADYDALKRRLAFEHAGDKSAYQDAKAPFILAVMARLPERQAID